MARYIELGEGGAGVAEAGRLLREGHLVAFPTDTVYGLGAHLRRPDAIERLYVSKGRPESKPIPVLVADPSYVDPLAASVPPAARELIRRFFPGPLTVVVPAAATVPAQVTAGSGGVGVRMPNHPLALAVIRECGGALAVTSANLSGVRECLTADEVMQQLASEHVYVLKGPPAPGGIPSTVVDATVDPPVVRRIGALPEDLLREAVPQLQRADAHATARIGND